MLDCIHPRYDGIAQTLATKGVRRHLTMVPVRLVHNGLHFLKGERRLNVELAGRAERIISGRKNFDPVRTVTNLFAHNFARVGWSRDVLIACGDLHPRNANIIRAGSADAARGNLHARTVEESLVNGISYVRVAITLAMGSHVSHRGETRPQIDLSLLKGEKCPRLNGCIHTVASGERVVNVCVSIHQARQHTSLTQVDHLGACRNLDLVGWAHVADAFALYHDHLVRQHLSGLAVKQPAHANRDYLRRLRSLATQQSRKTDYSKARAKRRFPANHENPPIVFPRYVTKSVCYVRSPVFALCAR